ncbi:MAG: ATP-binding protein [Desulfobacteraceae bacterium]
MPKTEDKQTSDDDILFASESGGTHEHLKKWKLLIIDDEDEIHTMTKLVLSDYTYQGCFLEFISGYSGKEAKQLIRQHPDAACMILDVVMESSHAGLDVAKYIREELKNGNLRIILRTGQPGKAPEKRVILDYDINDYKEKTELTSQKLFTTVTTAIRSYIHLQDLEKRQDEIADKNIRLSQEVARRIVAEANLEKYNKSLERMIEDKSHRLKESLETLEALQKKLKQAEDLSGVGQMASQAAGHLEKPVDRVTENLAAIQRYRQEITRLIEQYEIMLAAVHSNADTFSKNTARTISQINEIKTGMDLDTTLRTCPGIIDDSLEEMNQISETVSNLKHFLTLVNENREPVELNTLISKAVKRETNHCSRTVDIHTSFSADSRMAAAAPKSMLAVFSAIIKNACHAVGPSGIISVSTIKEDDVLTIDINDTGQGIFQEHMDRIFQPYVSYGKRNVPGLGLFFAEKIVRAHDGTIEIESCPGQGTSVIIKLPTRAG